MSLDRIAPFGLDLFGLLGSVARAAASVLELEHACSLLAACCSSPTPAAACYTYLSKILYPRRCYKPFAKIWHSIRV